MTVVTKLIRDLLLLLRSQHVAVVQTTALNTAKDTQQMAVGNHVAQPMGVPQADKMEETSLIQLPYHLSKMAAGTSTLSNHVRISKPPRTYKVLVPKVHQRIPIQEAFQSSPEVSVQD